MSDGTTVTHPIANGNRTPRPNFTEVTVDGFTEWISYKTVIGFMGNGWPRTVTDNYWGNTTGRHLATIGGTIGPLSQAWFRSALKHARRGGTIAEWFDEMRGARQWAPLMYNEPADDDIDPICADCNGTGSTPDVYGDPGPCLTCNVRESCDDCGGSGRAMVGLPEDEPTYWSDIADGAGTVECTTCDATGMVATVYAD